MSTSTNNTTTGKWLVDQKQSKRVYSKIKDERARKVYEKCEQSATEAPFSHSKIKGGRYGDYRKVKKPPYRYIYYPDGNTNTIYPAKFGTRGKSTYK
jgi:mRNA-degrading endonuclease RelE of RelBE toxin-antitoxin system